MEVPFILGCLLVAMVAHSTYSTVENKKSDYDDVCSLNGGVCKAASNCSQPITLGGVCKTKGHECCNDFDGPYRCKSRGGECVNFCPPTIEHLGAFARDCPAAGRKCCIWLYK